MNIYFNSQFVQIPENLTFLQLLQWSGQNGSVNDKNWQKNGLPMLIKDNSFVKDCVKENDQLTTSDKPYRQVAISTPATNQTSNQFLNNQTINRATMIQPFNQQNFQQQDQQHLGVNQQQFQQFNGNQQQQFQQPQQIFQQQNPKFFPQQIVNQQQNLQVQNQTQEVPQKQVNQDIDVFQTKQEVDVFKTKQEVEDPNIDIFSTSFQNSQYDNKRQDYLRNKANYPGDREIYHQRNGFTFKIENYGDDVIVENQDKSLILKLNKSYELKGGIRQFNVEDKKKQFETNIIVELNYTRISYIQKYELLAIQFNTGKVIAIQFYME